MSKVREGGGDFGGGVVVCVVEGLLAAGGGGAGEGVGDDAVGEDGEVHDVCRTGDQCLRDCRELHSSAWNLYYSLKKEKVSVISAT